MIDRRYKLQNYVLNFFMTTSINYARMFVNFSNFHRTWNIHVKVLIKNSEQEVADKIWREESRARRIHYKWKWSEGKIWWRNSLKNCGRRRWRIVYEILLNKQENNKKWIRTMPSKVRNILLKYYSEKFILESSFSNIQISYKYINIRSID